MLPLFERARVLVVGDVMLDRYWHGGTSRISPEAPVPVVHVRDVEDRLGGAANVAVNVKALGAAPLLCGLVGDDEAGAVVLELVRAHGIGEHLVTAAGAKTVTKMRVVSRRQQLIRLDIEDGFSGAAAARCFEAFEAELGAADVVVLSDYGKGALAGVGAFVGAATRLGKPVIVDPKGVDFSRYAGATVITPNLSEFEAVVGHCRDLDDLAARGERLCAELGLRALLITRSEQGMTLVRPGAAARHVPARTREVYDVTGAGDTVVGVLASSIGAGESIEAAARWANLAAGIVVSKLGTAAVSAEELERVSRDQGERVRGVVTEAELRALLEACRARQESVVMTNGCFDILHAGHVRYLARAKALGDRLVVAVNDDASVARLKGRGRPINPLARRMSVLAALHAVDWVVPFSADTPEALVRSLSPDVLVKGGDYRPEEIAGAEHVRASGGRVLTVEIEEECSTSQLIHRIAAGASSGSGR